MKYIDAEKLKARIEKYLTYDNSIDTAFYIGRRDAERSILELITSLQQEQPDADDLEEAAEKYSDKYCSDWAYRLEYEDAFIAGAEWQYQKDRGEFAKIKAKTWCEGFDAHKQQMLKDAVDLDADIEMEWDSFNKHLNKFDEGTEEVVWLNWLSFVDIANYFYNLGRNARKED